MTYDSCVNLNAFVKAAEFSALVFSGPVMFPFRWVCAAVLSVCLRGS